MPPSARVLLPAVVAAVLAIGAASAARGADGASPAEGPEALRCDGTDPQLFEEMAKNGTLGYGETWDEHTCDQGRAIYGEGADNRWRDMRTPRVRVISPEDQMLALVAPMVAVGGLGAIFAAAAALAFVVRLKKRVVLEVACPACEAPLPITADDKSTHQLFCPMCGAACSVEVTGKGKLAKARVLA